jgi:hypothetical protein
VDGGDGRELSGLLVEYSVVIVWADTKTKPAGLEQVKEMDIKAGGGKPPFLTFETMLFECFNS